MDNFVIGSTKFSNVFLRLDGTGVTQFAGAGSGTVNCQFGAGAFEQFHIVPQGDGTVAIESAQFPNVFIRMDGSGVAQLTAPGAGTVNCQFGAGAFEKFRIVPQDDGTVAVASAQFPNVFLRVDGTAVAQFASAGAGTVNCQFGAGAFEKFRIVPTAANMNTIGLVNVFQTSAEISGPVCPNGGHVVAVVNVIAEAGRIRLSAHAECENSCVTDNLEPSVAVQIIDANGSEVDSLALDIPTVPARGGNNPTRRSADTAITIDHSFTVKEIRFSIRNRSAGIPVLNAIPWDTVIEIVGTIVEIAA